MDTMYISVDESQMGVFFLDCFRFCMNDIEYDIILNKPDLDTYEYEIWKRTNREMSLVAIVSLSLDEFKEYYYGDEETTTKERAMKAVYASTVNHADPLAALAVGEQPEPQS